jgi:hypothetical protein
LTFLLNRRSYRFRHALGVRCGKYCLPNSGQLRLGLRPIWKFTVDAGGGRAGARLMHSHNSLTFLLCLRLPLFRLHTRIRMARCGSHIPILLGTRQAFETIFLVVAIFYLVVAWRNDEGCRRFWCCLWKSAAASYE